MGSVAAITMPERDQAYTAAIRFGRDVIGEGSGYLAPGAKLGSLSEFEWRKLAENVVSGWIIERSRQLSSERIFDETAFLAEGSEPEPSGLGHCAAILPMLGTFVEQRGLTDLPIGEWSKRDVILFVFNCADMVFRASIARDERPTDPDIGRTLLAG